MRLLDSGSLRFFITGGSLRVARPGEERDYHARCRPLFPITDPDRFIAVQIRKGEKFEELGIVERLADISPSCRKLVRDDIRFRHFVPEILDIVRISRKRGTENWSVVTDRGATSFTVADAHENIRMTDKGIVFITDTNRFRYKISDYRSLPSRSRVLVEKVLL